MPKATKPVRRSAADRGGYLKQDARNARRHELERRRAKVRGGKVWVPTYTESDGTVVKGHWRSYPRGAGVVPKQDWQQHVGQQLGAHANAVARAAEVKQALMSYAAMLAGGG